MFYFQRFSGAFKLASKHYVFAFDFVPMPPPLHILGPLDTNRCREASHEMQLPRGQIQLQTRSSKEDEAKNLFGQF